MKKITLLLIGVLAIASCKRDDVQSTNVISLLDVSESRDSSIALWYRDAICEHVLPSMGIQDKITMLPIDNGSRTASVEIFRKDFGEDTYGNQYAGLSEGEVIKANHADSVNAAVRRFRTAFSLVRDARTKYRNGTDIIGALKLAGGYRDRKCRNVLIIFSDMLHSDEGGAHSLESILRDTASVEGAGKRYETVDLSDFTVIVVTGELDAVDRKTYGAVQEFWKAYFKRCNANLVEYSSGSLSLLAKHLKR